MEIFVIAHSSASYGSLGNHEPEAFGTMEEAKERLSRIEAGTEGDRDVEYSLMDASGTSLTIVYSEDVCEHYSIEAVTVPGTGEGRPFYAYTDYDIGMEALDKFGAVLTEEEMDEARKTDMDKDTMLEWAKADLRDLAEDYGISLSEEQLDSCVKVLKTVLYQDECLIDLIHSHSIDVMRRAEKKHLIG